MCTLEQSRDIPYCLTVGKLWKRLSKWPVYPKLFWLRCISVCSNISTPCGQTWLNVLGDATESFVSLAEPCMLLCISLSLSSPWQVRLSSNFSPVCSSITDHHGFALHHFSVASLSSSTSSPFSTLLINILFFSYISLWWGNKRSNSTFSVIFLSSHK